MTSLSFVNRYDLDDFVLNSIGLIETVAVTVAEVRDRLSAREREDHGDDNEIDDLTRMVKILCFYETVLRAVIESCEADRRGHDNTGGNPA